MRKPRHLNAKGEFLYDYKYDILTFKIKGREYKRSIEFQNFVVDIDKEDFVTGARIFDASRVLGVGKYIVKNLVDGEFRSVVENKAITITLKFVSRVRNRILPLLGRKESFTQQITTPLSPKHNLSDSIVECPLEA